MNRRELIRTISILTGAAFLGADLFLVACKSDRATYFDKNTISFLDEVAETIIPKTNTPGAKEAETGKFIALYATNCYNDTEQKILLDGIIKLNEASNSKYSKDFLEITGTEKQEILTIIDGEAKKYNELMGQDAIHYFTLIKQLTLLGFFTSELGATQVLRYNPIPGKYEGCIPYKKGETAWA